MKVVSAVTLSGDVRDRWVKARKEMYRGVLRDPRSSEHSKRVAREKLKSTSESPTVPSL